MKAAQLLPHARALIEAQGVTGVPVEALARVLARGQVGRAKDGSVVIAEGTAGDAMYFLLEGEVRVRQRGLDGKLRELTTMKAPMLLGQMALIDGRPRSARCVADGAVVLVKISAELFAEIRDASSAEGAALRRFLLRCLMLQLTSGNGRLRELVDEPAGGAPTDDPSVGDLLRVTGALEGWETRDGDLSGMEVVVPEDR